MDWTTFCSAGFEKKKIIYFELLTIRCLIYHLNDEQNIFSQKKIHIQENTEMKKLFKLPFFLFEWLHQNISKGMKWNSDKHRMATVCAYHRHSCECLTAISLYQGRWRWRKKKQQQTWCSKENLCSWKPWHDSTVFNMFGVDDVNTTIETLIVFLGYRIFATF